MQQIVDKTIMEADKDGCVPVSLSRDSNIETDDSHSDGKLSFEEFSAMVSNTVRHSRVLIS